MKASSRRRGTRSSPQTKESYRSPTLSQTGFHSLMARVAHLPLGTLVLSGNVKIERNESGRWMRYVEAACSVCTATRWLLVWNVEAGKTTSCACQRNRKYHDGRAETLGQRFDAMVQRCERDTHVSSALYKGRGIKVLFKSREHFIRWALRKWPDTDFKGLVFDRKNNDGHYEPTNLRLVTQRENLKNRRPRGSAKRTSTTS